MSTYRRWSTRFQIKAGRWVYVPTEASVKIGRAIAADLSRRWTVPDNYFHLLPGGHVAALKMHAESTCFARLDISNFFGSITRTRVVRELKKFYPYREAWQAAVDSTVKPPGGGPIALPFGFVQSTILASICLYESRLGRAIRKVSHKAGLIVTVYVDDIVISGPNEASLAEVIEELEEAAQRAGFELHAEKRSGPVSLLTAFNIELSNGKLELTNERMGLFSLALIDATPAKAGGILGYVASVNGPQAAALSSIAPVK